MYSTRRLTLAGVAWMPLFVLLTLALMLVPPEFPRWVLMWSLAVGLYAGLKWLSWCDGAPSQGPAWKHAAYLLAWPGMDARSFLASTSQPNRPDLCEWTAAVAKSVGGAVLILVGANQIHGTSELIVGWCEMVGLVLLLHCGLFHLLSCFWRWLGLEAKPIMNSPLLATSVAEFWGRRWNLAFRDLTHRLVFRPLTARWGAAAALGIGFLISGIVHEVAISVPAGSGYGGPTAFFLLQAAAVFVERSRWGRSIGIGRGVLGWVFTASVLIIPVGLLLPPAFVCGIIVPFCHDVGRLVLNR